MNMEKLLKYIIWTGLIIICFTPLVVRESYYFPYIVPKTLIFRLTVEFLFLLFLGLAIFKKEYRPKLNLILVLCFLYLIVVFVSSLLGENFYFSFWSNNERSEGLLLLLHLLLYLIILNGFFKKTKHWLIIFDASYLSSVLVSLAALAQYLNLEWVVESSGGSRLSSTIGNAGYVAGYLIFNILFGFFLLFFRKNKYLRLYYVLGILLQIFIVFNTLTRGGILALFFSLLVFAFYLFFFRFKNNQLAKASGIVLLVIPMVFAAMIFLNKQADWVRNSEVLRRISTISASAVTAQNRLMTWDSAWQGFKERPLLGYGYENFYQVFDKYFNPEIYRHAGSVIWFDRAHNIIFDRLITGGLLGLFLYLALLFTPLLYLWRYFKKNRIASGYLVPIIFTLVITAYFIQNFFIFEALVTYIPLFMTLAFLSQFCPDYGSKFFQSKKLYLVAFTLSLILFLPIVFIVNVRPVSANKKLIQAMLTLRKDNDHEKAYSQFLEALDMETFGNQEYRQHFGEFISSTLEQSEIDDDWKAKGALRAEQEFDKQIEEKDNSARNYLMFMRFLNRSYQFNVERLSKVLRLAEKALVLSPTRPQIYYERGYTYYYLGKYYDSRGDQEKAEEAFNRSVADMKKALELNDQVVESYSNLIMILLTTHKSELIQSYLNKMDELGLVWREEKTISRIANSAIHAKEYEWTKIFYQELLSLNSDNPNYWINLALSYAYLGDRQKAIETAETVKKFNDQYTEEADKFIEDVLAGKYGTD